VKAFASTLLAALVCAFAVTTAARADEEDGLPSFKTTKKRDSKEFVTKVGTAIIKAARSKPGPIELGDYSYTEPKEGRRDLKIKMNFKGIATKKNYTADILVKIDSSAKDGSWEVLDIDYKDDVKPLSPSLKNIRALVPKFNK